MIGRSISRFGRSNRVFGCICFVIWGEGFQKCRAILGCSKSEYPFKYPIFAFFVYYTKISHCLSYITFFLLYFVHFMSMESIHTGQIRLLRSNFMTKIGKICHLVLYTFYIIIFPVLFGIRR